MNWSEDLPDKCPPEEAFLPNGMTIYRLATSKNYDENDFKSQRALNLNKKFKNISECIARSLSVYNDVSKCFNLMKLPIYKGRWNTVLEIELLNDEGLIMKTFKDPNHYSWWRTKNFNIDKAVVVKDEKTA